MSVPKPWLAAAIAVIVAGATAVGCSSRLTSGPLKMTSAQMDSILSRTTWGRACTTVDRVAVPPSGTTTHVTTAVRICPAANARAIGPGNATSVWVPVATMHNTGNYIEAKWGLEPNGHYQIWVYANAAGRATYSITTQGNEIVSGPYIGCNHPAATADSAAFGNCADNPLVRGARSRGGPSTAGADEKFEHTLLYPASGPAWISCTEGCCTTGAN